MRFVQPNGVAYFDALGWTAVDIVSLFGEAARLPLLAPNPRRLGGAHWSAVAPFERQAHEIAGHKTGAD